MTPNASAARKAHKFFDSYPQYQRKQADLFAKNGTGGVKAGTSTPDDECMQPQAWLSITADNVIDSAHYGYVYCMTLLYDTDGSVLLATGSGDESVKVRLLIVAV